MKIKEIAKLISAQNFTTDESLAENDVKSVFASDLMSDVLAFGGAQDILVSGLANPQVIRTAAMLDTCCVIMVRGKEPTQQMIDIANDKGIVLLATHKRMYTVCGLLYEKGLTTGE